FDEVWNQPGAARRFKTTTAVWGVGLLGETGLRTALAVAVSTQRFLELSPPLNWVILGLLFLYTRFSIRAGERAAAGDAELASSFAGAGSWDAQDAATTSPAAAQPTEHTAHSSKAQTGSGPGATHRLGP